MLSCESSLVYRAQLAELPQGTPDAEFARCPSESEIVYSRQLRSAEHKRVYYPARALMNPSQRILSSRLPFRDPLRLQYLRRQAQALSTLLPLLSLPRDMYRIRRVNGVLLQPSRQAQQCNLAFRLPRSTILSTEMRPANCN